DLAGQITGAGFRQCVDHVRAEIGNHARVGGELLVQVLPAIFEHLAALRRERVIVGGLAQSANDVGGHEHAAVVLFPPTPAAVVVLVVGKAVKAGIDFRLQIGGINVAGEVQLLHCRGNDYVGEKT